MSTKKPHPPIPQPKIRNWTAVAAHFMTGGGSHKDKKKDRKLNRRQARRQERHFEE